MKFAKIIESEIVKFWWFVEVINEKAIVDAATGISVLHCSVTERYAILFLISSASLVH